MHYLGHKIRSRERTWVLNTTYYVQNMWQNMFQNVLFSFKYVGKRLYDVYEWCITSCSAHLC